MNYSVMMLDHMLTLENIKWDSTLHTSVTFCYITRQAPNLRGRENNHHLFSSFCGSAVCSRLSRAPLLLVLAGLSHVSATVSHHSAGILGKDQLL